MADKNFVIKNGLVVGDTATINGVIINPSGATAGQVLKFNGTAFVADAASAVINSIDDITGVTLTNPANGDVLKWDGTAWVNASGYATLSSPTFTGTVTVPSPSHNTDAANKAYVDAAQSAAQVYADNLTVAISDITDGITADASEINILDGATLSAAELNILDGATLSTVELNYVDGVTSAIQTQLDAKAPLASPTFTGTTTTNDLTVSGNFTVSGTTTSINTETLTINDNIIVLNNNATGAPSENAGVEVERGSSTNVSIRWNESTDKWQFTNDGSTYVDFDKSPVTVSSSAPASPINGQLWFYQDTAQTFIYYGTAWIEVGAVSNGARVEVSSVAPASPATGDLWFDSDTAQTFTYYDSQWIEIGASGMAASIGDSAPASPISGQIWFDSTNASTNVYYDSQWVEVGGTTEIFNFIESKGDLIVGTADNVVDNLSVGTNGQVLTADSTTATGLKWNTPVVYQEVVANVSNTEIGYLDGVTSGIQTQINTKASTGKAIAMSLIFGGG